MSVSGSLGGRLLLHSHAIAAWRDDDAQGAACIELTCAAEDLLVEAAVRLATIANACDALRATVVPFNERTQTFFCTVCEYRDPLGPDGNQLHDDQCPLLELLQALDGSAAAPLVAASPALRNALIAALDSLTITAAGPLLRTAERKDSV